ncbi:MAG: PLP-dependent aminotransferase family protein [Chloroflexi bacterium]|nr:PLP-dependent aminotransferase family protein [Chloroflexota bacterium]
MTIDWNQRYAQRLEWMTTSAIRDILKCAQAPGLISLAGGWPEAELFPTRQLAEIAQDVITNMPRESLQYGLTDGFPPLRALLAEQMSAQGIPAEMGNIIITSGTQQSLDLLGRILLDEDDTVLVENPTFLGALQSFKAYGVAFRAVNMDDDGADVARLDPTDCKYYYALPTFQNPTGVTMSLARRKQLIQRSFDQDLVIIEDDPYGSLRFEGDPLPTLAALASQEAVSRGLTGKPSNVVYCSSFSKTLAPGLRLSWVVCPKEVAEPLVMAKQGTDLHTNALSQVIAYEFLRRGWLPEQIARIRETYRVRRQAMLEAIEEYLPQGIYFSRPQGGLFLWVELPPEIDTVALLPEAVEQQVAFVPGSPFYITADGKNTMRLTFASVRPELIREGIRRLGEIIKRHL